MNEIRSYVSVRKWIENVNRYYQLADSEWDVRMAALSKFCELLGTDPDSLIEQASNDKERKLDLMRSLRQIALELNPDPRTAHDWDNVVRSFFIHNGARVVVRSYQE